MKKNLRGNRYHAVAADGAVDWDHPLNRGRVLWLYAPPGVPAAGSRLLNLCDSRTSGTLVGGPTWSPTGRGDTGQLFDGADDVVRAAVPAPAMPLSIAAWVRVDSLAAGRYVCGYFSSTSNNPQFSISVATNGAVSANCETDSSGGGQRSATSAAGVVTAGAWVRLLAVFAGLSSRSIYVNGRLAATDTTSATGTFALIDRFSVGRFDRLTPALPLLGAASDPTAWSRALSDAEVLADYRLSAQGYRDPDSPLRWLSSRSYSVGGFSAGRIRRQQLIGSGVY